jgi:hypothetical protein
LPEHRSVPNRTHKHQNYGHAFAIGNQGTGADRAEEQAESCLLTPALSPLLYDILQVLRQLKATDPEKRATASTIAERVGGGATEQSCKAPLADLKHRGFVDSKTGRHGGSWLTPEGLALINCVRKP